MKRPKLLDLFCGAGGAGKGYMDAGFDVTGIDIAPQPDYPGTFIQGDALAYLAAHGHEYDGVHGSPPCQASCTLTKGTNKGMAAIPTPHKPHRGRVAGYRHGEWFDGPYFAVYGEGGGKGSVAQWQAAMGIDWTSNRKSIAEAIPPAYTRFIGGQLMQLVQTQRELAEVAA